MQHPILKSDARYLVYPTHPLGKRREFVIRQAVKNLELGEQVFILLTIEQDSLSDVQNILSVTAHIIFEEVL
jgi:hypothetical protein